jgi:predicted ferric reductase
MFGRGMGRLLPALYAVVIAAEIAALSWKWATNPPLPTSAFSINLGWVGLVSMVVMLVYSIARRSRALREWARLSAWLHFHIFLGVQGFVCVFFHSFHLFTRGYGVNLLNPAVLNFIAVTVVFFSGLYGRYMYSMLPRSMGGEQLAARDVEAELAKLGELPAEVQPLLPKGGVPRTFGALISEDLAVRASLRKLRAMNVAKEAAALVERRLKLQSRLHALGVAEKIFQRWIILHRPLASIMYILSIVHVVLSYMYAMSFTAE